MAYVAQDGDRVKYNDIANRGFAGQLTYGDATPPVFPQGQFAEYGDQPVSRLIYGFFEGRVVLMDMGFPWNLRYGPVFP